MKKIKIISEKTVTPGYLDDQETNILFIGCKFKGAFTTHFKNIKFLNCNLNSCRFKDNIFQYCTFTNCNLVGTYFEGVRMSSTTFECCSIQYIHLFSSKLLDLMTIKSIVEISLMKETSFKDLSIISCSFPHKMRQFMKDCEFSNVQYDS